MTSDLNAQRILPECFGMNKSITVLYEPLNSKISCSKGGDERPRCSKFTICYLGGRFFKKRFSIAWFPGLPRHAHIKAEISWSSSHRKAQSHYCRARGQLCILLQDYAHSHQENEWRLDNIRKSQLLYRTWHSSLITPHSPLPTFSTLSTCITAPEYVGATPDIV